MSNTNATATIPSRLRKGQRFDAPSMGCWFSITRVARDGRWADLVVHQKGTAAVWTKRQRLVYGRFAFPVEESS